MFHLGTALADTGSHLHVCAHSPEIRMAFPFWFVYPYAGSWVEGRFPGKELLLHGLCSPTVTSQGTAAVSIPGTSLGRTIADLRVAPHSSQIHPFHL